MFSLGDALNPDGFLNFRLDGTESSESETDSDGDEEDMGPLQAAEKAKRAETIQCVKEALAVLCSQRITRAHASAVAAGAEAARQP